MKRSCSNRLLATLGNLLWAFRITAAIAAGLGGLAAVNAQNPVIYNVRIGDPQQIAGIVANQNCPNWCWAAGCEMLVKSQGVLNIPQEEFVRRIYGPALPCLPTFGSLEPIRAALTGIYDLPDTTRVALTGAYHYGVPTDVLGMIRSIQEGRPFIFAWLGHAWVAYGINYFFTGPDTIQFTEIELIDPLALLSNGARPQFTSFVVGRDRFEDILGTFELLSVRLPAVPANPVIFNERIGNLNSILGIVANQNCSNWCWAASSEMLVKSQGIMDVSQEEFVRRIYGPTLPCLPSFGSFEPIRVAITGVYDLLDGSRVGLAGAYHYGMPTDALGMIRSIQQGRPFIFAWRGHALVAYGLNFFYTSPFTIQISEVELIDPLALLSGGPQFVSFVVGRDNLQEINGTFELLPALLVPPAIGGGNVPPGGGGNVPPGGGGNVPPGDDLAAIIIALQGLCIGDPGFNPAADLNGDGCIDLSDLDFFNPHDPISTVINIDINPDIDNDGDTDDNDFKLVEMLQGLCIGDPGFNPVADLNGDGCVDALDLNILLNVSGVTRPVPTSVDSPTPADP